MFRPTTLHTAIRAAFAAIAVTAAAPSIAAAVPAPVAFETWVPSAEAHMTDVATLSTRNVKVSPYFDCAPEGFDDYTAPNKTEVISVMTTTNHVPGSLYEGMLRSLNPLEHVPYQQELVVNWRNHDTGKSGRVVAPIRYGNFEYETGRINVGAGHVTFDATFTSRPGVNGTSSWLGRGQDTIHREWDVIMPKCSKIGGRA